MSSWLEKILTVYDDNGRQWTNFDQKRALVELIKTIFNKESTK